MTTTKKHMTVADKSFQSLRGGHHATVYEVRRDPSLSNKDIIRDKSKPVFPFIAGAQYKGEWHLDAKEGFGIQLNPDDTKYIGEWRGNKYHGRGTLWVKKTPKDKKFIRQYVGDWNDGGMEGQGIYYFPNGDIYRGEWYDGRRSGQGRMNYSDNCYYLDK